MAHADFVIGSKANTLNVRVFAKVFISEEATTGNSSIYSAVGQMDELLMVIAVNF